jgi:hypothetical protein
MDVEGAFDITRVSSIAAMLQRNQVPAGLRWTFLREHSAAMGHVVGAGGVSHDMERARSIPQRGSASPPLFNALIFEALRTFVPRWRRKRPPLPWMHLVEDTEDEGLEGILVWTDNIWVFADEAAFLQERLRHIAARFQNTGLAVLGKLAGVHPI